MKRLPLAVIISTLAAALSLAVFLGAPFYAAADNVAAGIFAEARAVNYGGAKKDAFTALARAADGGLIFAGHSLSGGGTGLVDAGGADAFAVRTDADGGTVWAKNFGGGKDDYFNAVTATADGGFVFAGYSLSKDALWGNNGSEDAFAVATDADGGILWVKNYGGSDYDYFNAVTATRDGAIIFAGYSRGADAEWGNNGGADAVAVAVNPGDGSVIWTKNYGGGGYDYFHAVAETSSAGLIFAGYSGGESALWGNNGGADAIAVAADAQGNALWAKNYGGDGDDRFYSVARTFDGYLAFAGDSRGAGAEWGGNGYEDALAIIADPDGGAVVCARNYGGDGGDFFRCVAATEYGAAFAGESFSTYGFNGLAWGNGGDYDAIAVILRAAENGAEDAGAGETAENESGETLETDAASGGAADKSRAGIAVALVPAFALLVLSPVAVKKIRGRRPRG